MDEQSITREHLFKMVKLQDQTLSDLHEENVQLRKDKAELREALGGLIDSMSSETLSDGGYYFTVYTVNEEKLELAKQLLNQVEEG